MADSVLPPPPPRPDAGATPGRERRGSIIAVSILTAILILGLAIIVFFALAGLIRTPWHTFPPGTSQAYFGYGFEALVSFIVGIPIAILVIIVGHVDLIVLRRIPSDHPNGQAPGRMILTVLLAACLAMMYLALAMQIYYVVISFQTE
jgi:hypothetical protein